MANTRFSILLLLLALSRQTFVFAHERQVNMEGKNVHSQSGAIRLRRGLLDGLVGAVLSPVLGTGGGDCSHAHADSVNIGATLPLGVSAGISGSSADAHSRFGCSTTAGSNAGGVNTGASASAGGNENSSGGSGTTIQPAYGGNEVYGQGSLQGSFSNGGQSINSGAAGTGVGWGSHSESHAASSSAGHTGPSIASNGPGNWGSGYTHSVGYQGDAPVRPDAALVSNSSS